MTNHLSLLTKDFFKKNPLKEISSARILYSMLVSPEMMDALENLTSGEGDMILPETVAGPDFSEWRDRIEKEESAAGLLRMIRQGVPVPARRYLFEKLLAREEEVLPEIQRLVVRTFVDEAVENCVSFLIQAKTNPTEWILENYQAVRGPYTRSTLCLALGFRADCEAIPFLMEQMEHFKKHFPGESFDQAPLIALHEIKNRFQKH